LTLGVLRICGNGAFFPTSTLNSRANFIRPIRKVEQMRHDEEVSVFSLGVLLIAGVTILCGVATLVLASLLILFVG